MWWRSVRLTRQKIVCEKCREKEARIEGSHENDGCSDPGNLMDNDVQWLARMDDNI